MRPVLLWTDALIWLLVAVGIVLGTYVLRNATLRSSWHKVITRPVGMASLAVLIVFVVVGLADSVHYRLRLDNGRYDVEVLSVLDRALKSLKDQTERTYSAPLATHAQAKEAMTGRDGKQIRDYPRLLFGGVQLADPERDWGGDVGKRIAQGLGLGILSTALFALLLASMLRARWNCDTRVALARLSQPREGDPAWQALILSLAVIFILTSILARLA
ncbi:MAG TPA: ABC transporter permease, partial [Gallionella sp.]|nr:ABC transporter permease [Gallionella sp.]